MISSSTVSAMSAPPVAGGVLKRLRKLLTRPIRLERRGFDFHFVFDKPSLAPGAQRADESLPRRRNNPGELPSMTAREVSEVTGFPEIMGRHDDFDSTRGERSDDVLNRFSSGRVETRGGLVQEQHGRIARQSAS